MWNRAELRIVPASARVMRMRQRSGSVCEEQKGSGGGEEARGWHAQPLSSLCSGADARQPFWFAASLCSPRFRLLRRLFCPQAEMTPHRTYFGDMFIPTWNKELGGTKSRDWLCLCNWQNNNKKRNKRWRQDINRKATKPLLSTLLVNVAVSVCLTSNLQQL